MKIYVKRQDHGIEVEPIEVQVEPSLTVKELKKRVQDATGLPTDQQPNTYAYEFGGEVFDDERTLSHYNIPDGGTISIMNIPPPVDYSGTGFTCREDAM